jgi:undecaprenyl-diphosphatase
MTALQNFNYQWFSLINANADLHGFLLHFSIFSAKYLVFLIPLWLIVLWMFAAPKYRGALLFAVIATIVALAINYVIGKIWFQPRPFMVPIGYTFLTHTPDSSFPSDHVTFIWAVGFSLFLQPGLRFPGSIMLIIALLVGWARVFLGVHFPLDVVGSIVIATLVVILLSPLKPWVNRRILPLAEAIYGKLCPSQRRAQFRR